ncbi:UCP1 [Symbiodinium natans]|uniref:UCP1 protein n=1 Tax=Symbiodinium natans TaxID=878477 RepID=A0A812RMX7_9DINO|nr:UCP1 [Symbiodinium natans]
MAAQRKLSVTENMVASGIAVVGATVVTHPIDVVKVQLQLSAKDAQADAFSIRRFVSFWAKFQSRVGLRGLFSGVQAAGLRAATYGSVRIGLCEPLQQKVGNKTGGAMIAGVLATVVGNPFEVLKVRLQARPGTAGELELLRSMLQEEGLAAFGRGFGWAAARSALLTASQVVPYASAKSALHRAGIPEGGPLHILASLVAGVVSTTVTAPVDVLKTKVMSSEDGAPLNVAGLLKKQGPFVFFKGWLANYVRIGPQTLFIFVFFEQSRRLVEHWGR